MAKTTNKIKYTREIERAIESLTGEENTDLIASGRTDAGVHALGQVANFKTNNESIPIKKFALALNTELKRLVRIKNADYGRITINNNELHIKILLIIWSTKKKVLPN